MGEKTRLFLIVFLPLLVSGAFLWLSLNGGDYRITDYHIAVALSNRSAQIEETVTYSLEKTFHELYRWFPPSVGKMLNVTGYTCPHGSSFRISRGDRVELICGGEFKPGSYTISFTYSFQNPFECDSSGCVFHWIAFDGYSVPIDHLSGEISAPFFTFPPAEVNGNRFEIRHIPPDTPLEIVAMASGTPAEYGRVVGVLRRVGTLYRLKDAAYILASLLLAGTLLIIYAMYGRDENPPVPEIIHYPPEDLKPHELDFYYSGFAGSLDKDTGDAVLLDLSRRGIVSISGSKIIIHTYMLNDLDEFETNLLNFYMKYGTPSGRDVVFDADEFKKQLRNRYFAREAAREYSAATSPTESMKSKLKQIYSRKGSVIARIFVSAYVFILFAMLNRVPDPFSRYVSALFIQGVLTLFLLFLLDNFVFGRYSPDARMKRAYWESFERLLKDYSLIKKYAPGDVSMWGKWLVYATVFGCADRVVRAMKELHIEIPNVDYTSRSWRISSAIAAASSSAHSSGGGFAGGGFGGGGGGAR